MPEALARDGARIFYERFTPGKRHSSTPVVLLMGVGMNGRIWAGAVREITRAGFEVLVIDNRGCGRSAAPLRPWTTATMAADCCAVLDQERIRDAHVIGASMGGMVAQELALRSPERVATLVLGCTSPGLPRLDLVSSRTLAGLLGLGLTSLRPADERKVRQVLELAVSRAWADGVAAGDEPFRLVEGMLADPTPGHGYLNQVLAAARHRTWARLHLIGAPTQVQHGTADTLIPFRAGEALAARIPDAELVRVHGAGHALILERPREVIDAALRFLEERGSNAARQAAVA
jgi:3-oxoadipate enol-lactonase